MMKTVKRTRRMNPLLGVLVAECDTTSEKIRTKLQDAYKWCFCELCWRNTEYVCALEARKVFKRTTRDSAKEVPLTDAMRKDAQRKADDLIERYEKLLPGGVLPRWDSAEYTLPSVQEALRMVMTYCNVREMRGDFSVTAFRDQVERATQIAAWSKRGDMLGAALLPNQKEGSAKPSKLYCEHHNPRRSTSAQRTYQRDRRLTNEYAELMSMIWSKQANKLPLWDIEAHTYVRKEAYRLLHAMKDTKSLIANMLAQGITNQAEIARQLGLERQAVSIAIKRHGLMPQPTLDKL
ncbi:hypothetical protein [Herminiimonas contaminans]|uniref:Uncharacterized protein n=1 Tax=Herminiimonas contaminans TaxID=1111140 RepID=A0ABS0EYW0_9BURK|nr:hypothetical protein [Herminiimonas contaminans]MBF8179462.1 hypothetical protein [Herminiimonas contaminans]